MYLGETVCGRRCLFKSCPRYEPASRGSTSHARAVYHRMHEAWDVLDSTGAVVGVLCPRTNHVSISPTQGSRQRAPEGRVIQTENARP